MKKILLIAIVVVVVVILILAVAVSLTYAPEKKKEKEPKNQIPLAIIDAPANNSVFSINDEIEFSAISSSDPEGEEISYTWQSNRSGVLDSSVDFKTQLEVGIHEITLTVIDIIGDENTTSIWITIYPLPTVMITSPLDDDEFYSIQQVFLNGSNCSSKYSTMLNYTWKSNLDGTLGHSASFLTNLSLGAHTITLEVDDGLSTNQEQVTISIIKNNEPKAVIKSPNYDDIFMVSSPIFFDSTGSNDPENHALYYNWTSNVDGLIGTETSFSTNLSAGTHIINLKVEDEYGSSSETSIVIIVNTPPIADAGADKQAEVNQKVEFDASNSVDPDGDDLTFKWDFGDGTKDVGQKVTHKFMYAGSYFVTLTVDDGKGGMDNDSLEVEVIYVFKGTGVYGYVYNNRTLKPLKNIDINVYDWDSGDDYSVETNNTGYYECHVDEGGEYWVEIWEDGYYDFDEEINIPNNQGIEFDIFLDPYPPENAKIFGHVYDDETKEPIEYADVDIEDDRGYYNYTSVDENGYYEMNVPAGRFGIYCYAWGMHVEYDIYYTEITFSEHQSLLNDIYLKRYRPTENNITLKFDDPVFVWNRLAMTETSIQYSSTSWFRDALDGDEDGDITQDEVDEYERMMELVFEIWYGNFTTADLFLVDDIDYKLIKGTVEIEIEGAVGPTASTDPITTTTSMDLIANHTITSSNTHTIKLMADYDDPDYYLQVYYIELPTVPSTYEMTNYTASNNVDVTNLTDTKILIDPLEDPDNSDDITGEWVEIEATKKS